MIKFFLNLILLFFYILLQISLLPSLGYPLNNLNLILSIIIFFIVIVNYKTGLWLAFGGGLILELFSIFPFGVITLSIVITAILVNSFFDNFFTNRSFYSLIILGLIGTFIYNFLLFFVNSIIYFINPERNFFDLLNVHYFYNLSWQIILNLAVLSLIFLILNFINRKLKSVFILSK
jgi:rod shape-determining protein MreD